MRLWRIAHRRYALDKNCAGAAMYGGRWNPIGLPALYCGGSIAITSLEKLVHLGTTPCPPLMLVAVDLPEESAVFEPDFDTLPDGWATLPTSTTAQQKTRTVQGVRVFYCLNGEPCFNWRAEP